MKARRSPAAPSAHNGPGFVRIISGQWRGRRLPVLNAEGLRPTTDRVKETLFKLADAGHCWSYCPGLF